MNVDAGASNEILLVVDTLREIHGTTGRQHPVMMKSASICDSSLELR